MAAKKSDRASGDGYNDRSGNRNSVILCLVSVILALACLFAGAPTAYPLSKNENEYESRKVILPFASYTPETSLMLGGLFVLQFKPGEAGTNTRSSQLLLSGIYTLNQQTMVEFMPNIIFPDEKWLVDGRFEYSHFPVKYWGVGSQTPDAYEMELEYRSVDIRQSVLRKMGNGWYAGPQVRFAKYSDIKLADQGDQSEDGANVAGSEGSTMAGFGFSVRKDERNSIVTPTSGHYLEFSSFTYPGFTTTGYSHTSWLLDMRNYRKFRARTEPVLAFQFKSRLTTGELPFHEYSRVGGNKIMRGYYMGRFRDSNAAQIQMELRQRAWWRFGFALFASAGEVWSRFDEFSLNNPKFAAGAGLRFNLNPEDTNHVRIDYGIGHHGSGFYVTIGEAF